MTFAREPIEIVELVQPICTRTFGVSPCMAVGTPCYNTDKTCTYRAALDMSGELVLQFVEPNANEWIAAPASVLLAAENGIDFTTEGGVPIGTNGESPAYQPALAIPALKGYQTAPTSLNVASGSQNKTPLGYRAVASIKIGDFPWNDYQTDPYRLDRLYDPETRGTFWTKWLSRNPFHIGYTLRVYEGVRGEPLDVMTKREYVVEKINHGRDGISITAKDILRKITDTNASAPALSSGGLSLDITIDATTFTAVGGLLADYAETGWVRIGSEIIAYTGRALFGDDVVFTGATRAQLGSTASAHKQFDGVQRVLFYIDQPFSDIIYDLLVTWGGINPAYIDKAAWDVEFTNWRATFTFTGYITKPEKIDALIGEICLQSVSNIWWDERVQKIILRAQRPFLNAATMTEDANIVAGSVAFKEKPEERVSQVWVYYGLRNWADSADDKTKYAQSSVFIDVDKQIQYGGEVAVRELTCRWIQTGALANNLASTYLRRFKDVRREITFEVAAQDSERFWTGDSAFIQHFLDVNVHGTPRNGAWLITSAEAIVPNGRYRFVAEDDDTSGTPWFWVDDALYPATWADASPEEREVIGYWLDDDGNDAGGNPQPFRWL
jgi:hypothetical protein